MAVLFFCLNGIFFFICFKLQFLIDAAPWFAGLGYIDVHVQTMSDYARGIKSVPRRRFTEHPTMYAVNRTGISDEMDIIQYDPNKREWFVVRKLPDARVGHQVVLVDNRFLFIIGGYTLLYEIISSVRWTLICGKQTFNSVWSRRLALALAHVAP